jgi:hypothetical protein
MASLLSIPVVGSPEQALLQVQSRLDGIFGRRRVETELVHDALGVLTEIIVIFPDDTPEEDIRAFRRALENIDGRLGVAITIPLGSSGGVSDSKVSEFDTQNPGAPVGFSVVGGVTVGGGVATGPNLLHTDGGSGLTLDLSTTPITEALPIQPGTLSISLDIGEVQTITDDGLGALTGTTGSLPGGGTINYVTGDMTGTTAALAVSSTVNESHTSDLSLSPSQSVIFDSGAAAGDAALICAAGKSIGRATAQLDWTFNLNVAPDFGLNNNAVAGAQPITMEARLLGALSGRDIVLQWATSTSDANPPTTWGIPAFVGNVPTGSPTFGITVQMDAAWHPVRIRMVSAQVLGVTVDNGTELLFTFTQDIVVPSKVVLNHNWGAALDRQFSLDNFSFSYALPVPA